MNYKFEFLNEEEKQLLINTHKDKFLIEEQNLLIGKFLVFSEEMKKENLETITLEQKVERLEVSQAMTDTTLLELMESLLQ